jgi:hypothetical protein
MAHLSRTEIIEAHPIGEGLKDISTSLVALCKELGIARPFDQVDPENNGHALF